MPATRPAAGRCGSTIRGRWRGLAPARLKGVGRDHVAGHRAVHRDRLPAVAVRVEGGDALRQIRTINGAHPDAIRARAACRNATTDRDRDPPQVPAAAVIGGDAVAVSALGSERYELFVAVLELVRVEALLPYFRGQVGRPEEDRAALARAFIAKTVFDIRTTRGLIERLEVDGMTAGCAAGAVPAGFRARRRFRGPFPSLPRAVWRAVCMRR